jgi:hypothetical protein
MVAQHENSCRNKAAELLGSARWAYSYGAQHSVWAGRQQRITGPRDRSRLRALMYDPYLPFIVRQ